MFILFWSSCFFETDEYGIINTKCVSNGELNIYGYPTALHCFSYSFNTDRKLYSGIIPGQKEDEVCVLVKNNWERTPTKGTMELFAMRLYEAERSCDVNIKAQKTPLILTGEEAAKTTLANLFIKYNGNEYVMYADKNQLGADSIRVIKTEAPFVADKLMMYKQQIWNEALTYLGIDNISTEKNERLVESEVSSNNELVNLNLQSRFAVRKYACKQFNELFGLTGTDKEIDVKLRSDLHNIVKTVDSIFTLENPEEIEKAKEVID